MQLDTQTLQMLDLVFIELKSDPDVTDDEIVNELAVGIECETGCRPGWAIAQAEAYVAGELG